MSTFAAQVSEWTEKTNGALEATFHEAAQDVVETMQKSRAEGGFMRIDTGFLRASLLASTSAMPPIISGSAPPPDAGPDSFPYVAEPVNLVINSAELGSTLFIGYTAAYAAYREFGSHGQPGDGFVRLAAQRWPEIVKAAESRVMTAAGVA